MKKYHYFWLGLLIYPQLGFTQKVGQICHTHNAPYNYAGLWKMDTFGKPICNYWQFLSDKERETIESHLNEYGEVIFDEHKGFNHVREEEEPDIDEGTFIIIEE
ncbi:hypothetical protein EV697_101473 [Bisgaardia hudsonensis]|uniref:Uncharacterized protein n=1 Tax=Bisgaardia hudsonensis TaxID=109472 RepID=A0A4R2N3D9_9PAST|nr:hypothetical protein [Bisgaardia hudsonensis]QLB12779.1 hypothetical protein A6A11_03740 [Bisgaardia hudsonensis]TCP14332.1 hypothetical protein EV697_101473 [Bisgaardia hudsonensis]